MAVFGIITTNKINLMTLMIIESFTLESQGDFRESYSVDGTVDATNCVPKPTKMSASGILRGLVAAPSVGSYIAIGTDTYEIRESKLEEKNTDWMRVSIGGVKKTW